MPTASVGIKIRFFKAFKLLGLLKIQQNFEKYYNVRTHFLAFFCAYII